MQILQYTECQDIQISHFRIPQQYHPKHRHTKREENTFIYDIVFLWMLLSSCCAILNKATLLLVKILKKQF